jgi:polyisoprenoid-binding protein YceI
MKRQVFGLIVGSLMIGLSLSSAGAEELALVKESSKIEFVGSKPEGQHKGGFKAFEVNAIADFETPGRSSINIQIDTTSLWSDDDRLTNHLKSPDFFDVRKHPAITFESTEIVPKEGDDEQPRATIKGTMEMLGKAVAVEIPAEVTVSENSIRLQANFTIDRTQWGMSYGQGKINNAVKISTDFTFKR